MILIIYFLNSACQQGWSSHGTSCYKLFTSPKKWENAKKECENRWHARLVKIESPEENDYIKAKLLPTYKDDDYWIGLSHSVKESYWKWIDGTPLVRYENWGYRQPNDHNNNEDCVAIRILKLDSDYYGKWHDLPCSYKEKYICEKP